MEFRGSKAGLKLEWSSREILTCCPSKCCNLHYSALLRRQSANREWGFLYGNPSAPEKQNSE
jgi:hypothetical protein